MTTYAYARPRPWPTPRHAEAPAEPNRNTNQDNNQYCDRPWRHMPAAGTASPVEFHLSLAIGRHRRQEAVIQEHRPSRRRLRIVRFAGFPLPALITRCECCGAIWPCRELFTVVRARLGWTAKLDRAFARLRQGPALPRTE